jgi:hypothetical protein
MQVTFGDDGSPSAPAAARLLPRDTNMGEVAGARRDRAPRRLLLSSSRASPGGAGSCCCFSARPGLAAGCFIPPLTETGS